VHIDTGDDDADYILRKVPLKVWERIALEALGLRLALDLDIARIALDTEMREPGGVYPRSTED
jgi:hypothetical protein